MCGYSNLKRTVVGASNSAYSSFGSVFVNPNPNSQTRIVIMEKYVKPGGYIGSIKGGYSSTATTLPFINF